MDLLKGKYFHIYENGEIERQGMVVGAVGLEYYLIQYFDFLIGEPSDMSLVTLSDISGNYKIYETAEEMRTAYERSLKHINN